MELNEREAHCVARRIQGVLYAKDPYIGCRFCRFKCDKGGDKPTRRIVNQKLSEATGVDLSGVYKGILRPPDCEDKPLKPPDFRIKLF